MPARVMVINDTQEVLELFRSPFGIDDQLHAIKQGLQGRRDAVSLGDPGETRGSSPIDPSSKG